ncbi:glycosyltransferase family 2 protein [Acinetobacter nosocomialis]|uniref:glycosyltransferase family 2 protein n=1 Tax=Acinetobacter nosocomialis TaxID=106654 RepID=UPI000DE5FB67|nr:glycosyltransferase family 2 protein [Acinetobacter nosocomialis]SSR40257.1 glycosyl transferase [Acinetobacter baumannii]MBO8210386.1 glycosyltransferase family 2 protein [Acinetobacter nosocomialis]MBO8226780.1 glycosyltransferase family 2 protein [Acinetobacter nosocomialis]MBO8252243.1 glycosyltransferase family 2 protein [Acinetobacter nosocomialis]MBR7691048.1 glycosyltransferase family 2 protein [Acinetobacter nosocomialis]
MSSIKISVCMATYNGEKYIKEQLLSILTQISETDEVIISDDSSIDNTLEIIKSVNDSRVKVYKNCFRNVVKNFEFSISKATGDIIFLSDQDDIWHPDKVRNYIDQFNNINIGLVISNLQLIDKNGNEIKREFFEQGFRGGFLQNLIKNNFIGCSMAFRQELVSKVLPFPNNIPMHDWWIGLIALKTSRVKYIDKKLTYYRRHDNNVTSDTHSSFKNILIWRLNLISKLIFRI